MGRFRRQALVAAAGGVAIALLSACAGLNAKPEPVDIRKWPEIRADARAEVLKARVRDYAVTFAAEVDLAAMSIERRAVDPDVRRQALLWRLRAIPEMRKACFRPEPLGALIDAWTLSRQMEDLFSRGAAAKAFGPFQSEAVDVSRRLVSHVRDIGGSITVSSDANDRLERDLIDPWLTAHPLHDIEFVRESPMVRFAEYVRARGDVFQSVGGLEETLLDLSQHTQAYLNDLPRLVRGEVDLLRADVAPPDAVSGTLADMHLAATSVDRLAATLEKVPALVQSERQMVLDDIDRQRTLSMQTITAEREAFVNAAFHEIAAERKFLLEYVEAQRLATMEWAIEQRRDTLATMHTEMTAALAALRGERVAVVNDVRDIVTSVMIRVFLLLVAVVVLAPLIAHAYVRVWPRRPR